MKPGLQIGHTYEYSLRVTDEMKAQFQTGSQNVVVHPLYSTASMISHMEWASRQHILPYLQEGEEGVGYQVEVKHLNPAPIGAIVRIKSVVTEIQPHKITSQVETWWGDIKIGEGIVVQAIVPLKKLHPHYPQQEQETLNDCLLTQPQTVTKEAPFEKWVAEQRNPEEIQDFRKNPTHNDPNAGMETPLPAVLTADDGSTKFTFEVLAWENPFPCTRYDEWLICRATLENGSQQNKQEGPFLLRYEIEELMQALDTLLKGNQAEFCSDFLEPRIKLKLVTHPVGQFKGEIHLMEYHRPGQAAEAENLIASFSVSSDALQAFFQQLKVQMEGFYSKI